MTKEDLFNFYSSDPELVEKFHIKSGEGIQSCVDDTWELIKDHELFMYDFGYFSKFFDGGVARVGGFFISPEFRNFEGKTKFFNELADKMPNLFLIGIYNKNVRGLKFLERLPGSNIITTTDSYTLFMFRQEKK